MKKILLSLLLLVSQLGFAQDYAYTDSLKQNLANATSAKAKVLWLGKLASFYQNLNTPLSDQYAKEMLQIAELSRDRELMIRAQLSLANSYYNSNGMMEMMKKARRYSQQAFDLAKSSQLTEYQAWGYMYLARGARVDGENDKALNYNNLALSIAAATDNDSLKVYAYNSLGNTYSSRKEKLLCFRNYLQAMNIAEESGKYELLKTCYQSMAFFYVGLEEHEKAKDYLFKNFKLTKKFNQPYDRLEVYNSLGDTYTNSKNYDMAMEFYERSLALADTLKFSIYRINTYSKILDMYFMSNQAEKALKYFKEKKELSDFMHNAGVDFFVDHAYGLAYLEMGKYDSSLYHFRKAEPDFETRTSKFNRYYFYTNYANCYKKMGNYNKSLEYYLKARKIGEDRGDLQVLKTTATNLDTVYQKIGDFKNAYYYNTQYHVMDDSLQTLEAEKDLLTLEVDNENQRKLKEAKAEQEATRARHNIQYMGITAGIAGVFIVLVMMGTFSVSKTTIRILGFFAFIFLFEFIILLADNQIHHLTHGEPWKILAIKIVLISMLLPLHHFLEEKVIHFLTERKLITGNAKDLFQKFTRKSEPVS